MASFLKILAGSTGTKNDKKLALYLNFLAGKIPIKKITHLHVVRKIYDEKGSYKLFNDAFSHLEKGIKKEGIDPLLAIYTNVNELEAIVNSGKVLSRFKEILNLESSDIIAVGKKEKGSSALAKNIIRKLDCNTLVVPENSEHTFTNILVPVDLSQHSEKILQNAIAIQENSSEVVFITCIHAYEIPDIPYYNVLRTSAKIKNDTRETVKEAFDKFIEKNRTTTSNIEPVLIEETNNWPSHYILKYIENNDVDFVLMGSQSHSKLDSIMGSTVEKVITKNNKCPILIIK